MRFHPYTLLVLMPGQDAENLYAVVMMKLGRLLGSSARTEILRALRERGIPFAVAGGPLFAIRNRTTEPCMVVGRAEDSVVVP